MDTNFQACLDYVLADEGGNDDDPADSGGRTSRGIEQREYNAWLHLQGRPPSDVWKAPQSDIVAIYQQQYWQSECPVLPVGIDYLFFDMKVNMGPHRATVLLQEALGKDVSGNAIADDGHFGVITMAAAKAANPAQINEKLVDLKTNFYHAIERAAPKNLKFDRGWMNRLHAVHDRTAKMIDVAPAPQMA